jgi:HK97 family phage portal protein
MVSRQLVVYDGKKAVAPWGVDSDRGWEVYGEDVEAKEGAGLFFRRVPWLYRGVMDRANNVSRLPWFIVKGDKDYDDFTNYKNALKFLKSPRRLLRLVEQSLAMAGRAYLFLETNPAGYIQSVKYCKPSSIEEVYNKRTGELEGYKRKIGDGSQTIEVAPENIVAFYLPDYATEIGPGKASPAAAALMAAGVLFNASGFIATFFRRGAIKATVLTTENASQQESERLQRWWDDVVAGVKNAWSAIVLRSKAIVATVIGEGLESLQNKELTREQRQDVATALGVPESRMWSAAANYATRIQDDKAYYESTIIPECDLIAEALNDQMFNKEHHLEEFRIEARYETIDIFQEDAKEQAAAYASYVTNGMKPSTAAEILGIELPSGMEYEDLDPEEKPEPEPQPVPPQTQPDADAEPDAPQANEQERRSVLSAWKRKAELSLKKSENANCEFVTTIIPAAQADAIRAALAEAKTKEDVAAAFEVDWQEPGPIPDTELKRSNDLMERALEILQEVRG